VGLEGRAADGSTEVAGVEAYDRVRAGEVRYRAVILPR
jgi:hypothetical protein